MLAVERHGLTVSINLRAHDHCAKKESGGRKAV